MLDHAACGSVERGRCGADVVEKPIPIRLHVFRVHTARVCRCGEGVLEGRRQSLEVVVMPVFMIEGVLLGVTGQASVQVNGWAKCHSDHLSAARVRPVPVVLKAAGVLMRITAPRTEHAQGNPNDAHVSVAAEYELHTHWTTSVMSTFRSILDLLHATTT
jgi:hypothetical protein